MARVSPQKRSAPTDRRYEMAPKTIVEKRPQNSIPAPSVPIPDAPRPCDHPDAGVPTVAAR
ncbi:MAG: hypothetical protein IPM45_14575 [Acidimicrobiales bacterium]|nr:hypothetical protein [Acidimicrobiales bacterium]